MLKTVDKKINKTAGHEQDQSMLGTILLTTSTFGIDCTSRSGEYESVRDPSDHYKHMANIIAVRKIHPASPAGKL